MLRWGDDDGPRGRERAKAPGRAAGDSAPSRSGFEEFCSVPFWDLRGFFPISPLTDVRAGRV